MGFENDKRVEILKTYVYNRDRNTLEIRESKIYYGVNSVIMIVLIFSILLKNDFNYKEIHSFFWVLSSIMLVASLYGVYKIIDRKIKLRIDDTGIFHYKHGQMLWANILSIKKMIKREGRKKLVTLFIQTATENSPLKISLSNLDKNFEEIELHIKRFKDFNIYEINKWEE